MWPTMFIYITAWIMRTDLLTTFFIETYYSITCFNFTFNSSLYNSYEGGLRLLFKTYTFNSSPASYGRGSTVSRQQSHNDETVYFLPLSPQEFLVLIWWTSEGWKTESTLEILSGSNSRPLDWESSALTRLKIFNIHFLISIIET